MNNNISNAVSECLTAASIAGTNSTLELKDGNKIFFTSSENGMYRNNVSVVHSSDVLYSAVYEKGDGYLETGNRRAIEKLADTVGVR